MEGTNPGIWSISRVDEIISAGTVERDVNRDAEPPAFQLLADEGTLRYGYAQSCERPFISKT